VTRTAEIGTFAGALATDTCAVAVAVLPRPSVTVAETEWAPSGTAVVSQIADGSGCPSTEYVTVAGRTALVWVVRIVIDP
jgi:hypothetical protein